MLRPAANEIPRLIRRLRSGARSSVDAARARLSIIGARAVEDLIVALEGDDDRTRARVMPLLALIQDPRGREPLTAMLLDQNPRLRAIAARSLARFPSESTVGALNRLLERERSGRVRVAAVQALVELYAAGQEGAVRRLLELLTDPAQPAALRLSGFALLPVLPTRERRTLLARLKNDPDLEIRRRAESGASEVRGADKSPEATARLLSDLGSDDYSVWNRSVQRLAAQGNAAAAPLFDEMERRAHDPEYCARAGMALKAMGPRRVRLLAQALDRMAHPLPLQVLVDVVGALGVKSLIYRLKDLIDRLEAQPASAAENDAADLMQRVRAKAHLELARVGSRVAIDSLRQALDDRRRPVELELLAAVELIGKREEIGVLLRAHAREGAFMQERIAHVVRSIMKRERIRRNNPVFLTFDARQRDSLEAILPPRRARGANSGRPSTPQRTP